FRPVPANTRGGWGAARFRHPRGMRWFGGSVLDRRQHHAPAAMARGVSGHLGVPSPDRAQIPRRRPTGIPGAGARALRHGPRRRRLAAIGLNPTWEALGVQMAVVVTALAGALTATPPHRHPSEIP